MNSLLISLCCTAQTPTEDILSEIIESRTPVDDDVDEYDWEEESEALSLHLKEPLNLNAATREELQLFPFLTDLQIEHLLAYIYLHGPMQTLYELQLVEDWDRRTIDRIRPFVCVKPAENSSATLWKTMLKNALKYGKNECIIRTDIPFYKRKGYEQVYTGSAVYNAVRHGFRYRQNLYAGIVAEKDAGEPFASHHNRTGYDHYGFHLFLRNFGKWKAIALGDYRMSFGQGLVVGDRFSPGKTVYATSQNSQAYGIRKHSSTDEYHYFRGAAATFLPAPQWEVSAFYSYRLTDGDIKDGKIVSIRRTGLHRSAAEAEDRRTCALQVMGGRLNFRGERLQIAATGLYGAFDREYNPRLTGYARHRQHGREFRNAGLDYSYRRRKVFLQGETAIGTRGWATLNRMDYSVSEIVRLLFAHRFYSYDYWGWFARSFGENGRVQNENGGYAGIEATPFRGWRFFASVDVFRFPYKQYRISRPSDGMEVLFQADFSPFKQLSMYARYGYERKDRDRAGSQGDITLPTFRHRCRYRLNYAPSPHFSLRTTADFAHFHSHGQTASSGYQATQRIAFGFPHFPLRFELQGTYFHTADYDSRIYVAERGLRYGLYTPAWHGRGFRGTAHLRGDFGRHWTAFVKFGQTVYADRKEIGSGNDLIRSNKKADVQIEVIVKL